MSFNRWMVIQIYGTCMSWNILLSGRKGTNYYYPQQRGWISGNYVKWKKVNLKGYILYDSILYKILELTKLMEIEKTVVVARFKEGIGLGR